MELEKSIKQWRKKLQKQGAFEDGQLEELESHLRDTISHLKNQGMPEEKAFDEAVRQMGEYRDLSKDYSYVRQTQSSRIIHTFFPSLLANYLKIGFRQFRRNKIYSWINISGLALGLSCFLFIAYFVTHELSYDTQYKGQPIFRISNQQITESGALDIDAGGPVPLATVLEDEFPEVEEAARFWRAYLPNLKVGDRVFEETEFVFTDSATLEFFHFEMLYGNPKTALNGPNQILLSESMALKYFNTTDIIGKTLDYNGYPGSDIQLMVTGVFKNLPSNTHFSFDFLCSFTTLGDSTEGAGWGSFKPVWTYIKLGENTDLADFEDKLQKVAQKYFPDRIENNKGFRLILEPIADIYLHSQADRPMKPNGSLSMIRILAAIGLIILIMSSVNFVNISLSRAITRQKEIGMRKVLGAVRGHLVNQFLIEVAVTIMLSLIFAVVLCFLFKAQFTALTGLELTLTSVLNPSFMLAVGIVLVLLVLLSGIYPALYISGFNTISALTQKLFKNKESLFSLRQGLTLFQCIVSSVLIMGILVIKDQLDYIRDKSVGVNMEQILVIPRSDEPEVFEQRLSSIPGVISFTTSQQLPVNDLNYDGRIATKPGSSEIIQIESCFVSPNFLDFYKTNLLSGRSFNLNTRSDTNKFVINETAAHMFGWDRQSALDQELIWSGFSRGRVIGVVEDFHLSSVHEAIPPMIMLPTYDYASWKRNFISVKVNASQLTGTLAEIEQNWREMNTGRSFSHFFLEDSYRELHHQDFKFARLILIFTVIAIAISGMGLFALSAYSVERRRKEMGIRKVLGSSIAQVFFKVGTPFLIMTGIAILLAVPLIIWSLSKWLNTFAYHTEISYLSLVLGMLIVLSVTLLSIVRESLRASLINPVKLLREE